MSCTLVCARICFLMYCPVVYSTHVASPRLVACAPQFCAPVCMLTTFWYLTLCDVVLIRQLGPPRWKIGGIPGNMVVQLSLSFSDWDTLAVVPA